MNLSLQIEDLISKKATGFEVAKLIRRSIKEYFNSIGDILQNSHHGKDFFVKHTKKIDEFVKVIYGYVLREEFEDYIPFTNSIPIVLTALGSYGREELCIHSDIDVMIVYKNVKGFNTEAIIESVLRMMWDTNLKIGHRVHEVGDLFEASKEDITIKTAMLEARYICGSKILWIETQRELNSIRRYKTKEFVLHKYEEYLKRSEEKPLNMEPNIKDGAGGLRDVNTLYWIVNVLYNAAKIRDMVPSLISEKDYKDIRMALEFLYKVRLTLHLITGKKQDTLLMELLPDVAKMLKIKGTKYKSASLQLSSKTFESLWTIKTTCNILIKKFVSSSLFDSGRIPILREKRVSERFFICDGVCYTSLHNESEELWVILREISALPDENFKYDISVVNYLRNSRTGLRRECESLINSIVKELFFKEHVYELMYAVYQAGLLGKIIPPLKKIIHLAQFDGYHNYPVDIHLIKTLKHLEDIKDEYVKNIYDSLDREERRILKFAAFLHDSGKGRRRDHSEVGAELVKVYGKKIGLKPQEIKRLALLVEHHTLMSNVANREDIYNEKTVLRFISKIETPANLKMLYVLTYADINAVGEGVYSFFTAKLLRELYELSVKKFINKNLLSETAKRLRKENILKRNPLFISSSKVFQKKILSIPSNFLFLKYKASEIFNLSKWAYELSRSDREFDYKIENGGNLSIYIIRKKELNLGYLLGKLSYLNLVNMDIVKLFDNIKYFKIDFHERVDEGEIFYIRELIENSFDMSKRVKYNKPFILKEEIVIDCDHSESYGEMKLNAKDQKGLMAYIIAVFDDLGIDIVSAKIQTIKKRAINLFILEKNNRFCRNINKIYDTICS